jgi:hypothetical protein
MFEQKSSRNTQINDIKLTFLFSFLCSPKNTNSLRVRILLIDRHTPESKAKQKLVSQLSERASTSNRTRKEARKEKFHENKTNTHSVAVKPY